jgi:hypothetical protein
MWIRAGKPIHNPLPFLKLKPRYPEGRRGRSSRLVEVLKDEPFIQFAYLDGEIVYGSPNTATG